MYLTAKKVDYIFEERLIFIYLLVRFFSVLFWIPGGNIEETIYFELRTDVVSAVPQYTEYNY